MKYLSYIITIVIIALLASCGQKVEVDNSLEGKQALLKSKKTALSALQTEIEQLSEEVKELLPEREKKKRIVTTHKVEATEFIKYLNIQSSIVSDDIANLTSEIPGRIIMLNAKEGDYLKKGQLVANIDMESVDKQIAEIEVSLDLAKTIFERQKRLWDQNIGSEMQYLQAKNSVERLEKSMETVRFQQSKSKVYSPISGYVDREILKQGDLASPGMPILQILNTYKVKAVADVPENYLSTIKRGDYVDLYIPALDMTQRGKITMLGRSIDTNNRTFKVEVALSNPKGILKPNLLVEMKIKEMNKKDAIVLPTYMVQQEISGADYVYVVDQKDGKNIAKKVLITTGENNANGILIEEGLNPNDIIIDEGARKVAEGEELLITNNSETSK